MPRFGIVHSMFQPVPGEFDDYIAKPKANNYRSLHTSVIGPQQRALEVQIRTRECIRPASTASPLTGTTRAAMPPGHGICEQAGEPAPG